MCYAAAGALSDQIGDRLGPDRLLPTMDDWDVFPREAAAVGMMAQKQGLARVKMSEQELLDHATAVIKRSRALTQSMMDGGFIPPAPEA
jgi:malate dehydrogenase (oxaloacetate-decarboxylating)